MILLLFAQLVVQPCDVLRCFLLNMDGNGEHALLP